MNWNWQQPDWPNFTWDAGRLRRAEELFLLGSGSFLGTARHLGSGEREQLTLEAISSEAITTSEIEREILDRASVQASIRKQLGLATVSGALDVPGVHFEAPYCGIGSNR